MNKRAIAAVLWFLTGWTLGLMGTAWLGTPALLAPLAAVALGAGVGWDWTGKVWVGRVRTRE